MKKSKPTLEWKLSPVDEKGQRRLPISEAEEKEFDEIVQEYRDDVITALACARLFKEKARAMSKDSKLDKDLRRFPRKFVKIFGDIEQRIRDGRGLVGALIMGILGWNEMHSAIRKPNLELASRRVAQIRRLHPNRRKGESAKTRRSRILEPIFQDTQKHETVNKLLLGLPAEKRRVFSSLPLPKKTFHRYLQDYKKTTKTSK